MNLFENLQLMKEANDNSGIIFMNKNNHTLQFVRNTDELVGTTLPRNYAKISMFNFNEYSNGKNTIDLLDLENPYEAIERLFKDKPELITTMKDKFNKYLNDLEVNAIKKDDNKCPICGTRLNDQGECPKCNDFPDFDEA